MLKLQTEKKPVELIDWTDEESEVKGFLQCLPYISQLRSVINTAYAFSFILNKTINKILEHGPKLLFVVMLL